MSRVVARVGSIVARSELHRSFFTPEAARAPFPASIYIAEFVGEGDSSIVEIQTGHRLLSAYARYDTASHELQRVALLNTNLFNGTATKDKQKKNLRFMLDQASRPCELRGYKRRVALLPLDLTGVDRHTTYPGLESSGAQRLITERGILPPGKFKSSL